jgi:hypothetical protein
MRLGMAARATRPEEGSAPDNKSDLSWRERLLGAVFVLLVIAAQTYWMGPAIILLSGGLAVAYAVWAFGRWKNDVRAILPMYLLAIAVQCLHFTEEYVTGFQRQFPRLLESQWSDPQFVTFNLLWLAAFGLAGLGVYRRLPLAYLIAFFLALIGGVGNGASHLLLSAMHRGYFPGLITAPLCLAVGIVLLKRLFFGAPVGEA